MFLSDQAYRKFEAGGSATEKTGGKLSLYSSKYSKRYVSNQREREGGRVRERERGEERESEEKEREGREEIEYQDHNKGKKALLTDR